MKLEIHYEKYKLDPESEALVYDFNIPASEVAERTGLSEKNVYYRRSRIKGQRQVKTQKHIDNTKKYYEKYSTPERIYRRWTEDEIKLVLTSDLPDKEICQLIGRSLRAVEIKRSNLRKTPFDFNSDVDPSKIKEDVRRQKAYRYIIENHKNQTIVELSQNLGVATGTIINLKKELRERGLLEKKKLGRRPNVRNGRIAQGLEDMDK